MHTLATFASISRSTSLFPSAEIVPPISLTHNDNVIMSGANDGDIEGDTVGDTDGKVVGRTVGDNEIVGDVVGENEGVYVAKHVSTSATSELAKPSSIKQDAQPTEKQLHARLIPSTAKNEPYSTCFDCKW